MSGDAKVDALGIVETYIGDTVESLLSNARALEAHPGDRHVGARVQSDLILLDRLCAVRRGLRE